MFLKINLFLAVLGTAAMLSNLADQQPFGKTVGWFVVAASWIIAFLVFAFIDETPGKANQSDKP